nr:zinc finger, CCHC-type [Tanacetum cinerariifolium]
MGIDDGETTNEKKYNTSKAIIFQTLPQDMLMQVAQYTTAKEVWNSIKVKHLRADLVQKARLQTLRSELETLKMKPNDSANEFARKLSSIQAKFKSLGVNFRSTSVGLVVGNKMHKAFPLLGESSHWQYKFLLPVEGVPTARRMEIPLL